MAVGLSYNNSQQLTSQPVVLAQSLLMQQRAALAVESSRVGGPATPASASDPSSSSSRQLFTTLDDRSSSSASKSFKFRQTQPLQQKTNPAAAAPHNRGSTASAVHKVPSLASKTTNMLAYMRHSAPQGKLVILAPIAKPVGEQQTGLCWVTGYSPSTALHSRWQ